MLPPGATEAFAREHDAAVCTCLATLLSQDSRPTQALPQPTKRLVHLPLRFGGPGGALGRRRRSRRLLGLLGAFERLVRARQSSTETVLPLTAARHAAACLREQDYDAPAWGELLQARPGQEEREFGEFFMNFCEAGSIVLPSPVTSAHLICIFLTLMPHLERCC